jgi:16S rRNA processing protein RimM
MGHGDRVVLGRVLGAFGVQGWLRVKPFTESFDGLIEQPVWTLSRPGTERQVAVEEWKPHQASLLVKVKGIDDRDQAEAFRGADVTVPRDKLPGTEEGEYYWSDLIGLTVQNVRGEVLGTVSGLIAAPAHDVLRVESSEGNVGGHANGAVEAEGGEAVGGPEARREQLIPFVEPIVKSVDIAARTVTVEWEADY